MSSLTVQAQLDLNDQAQKLIYQAWQLIERLSAAVSRLEDVVDCLDDSDSDSAAGDDMALEPAGGFTRSGVTPRTSPNVP